ncbi:MAG: hypothetical protein IPJ00_19330 [Saprospirales bacterium]|nr:hypothetical protein [Saprospirales bacterium]
MPELIRMGSPDFRNCRDYALSRPGPANKKDWKPNYCLNRWNLFSSTRLSAFKDRERDVVIISMTTSDPNLALEKAEFFFKPNRLNVALTRPRMKRIVIASSRLFEIGLTIRASGELSYFSGI